LGIDSLPLTSVGKVDEKVPRDMHQREDACPNEAQSLRAVEPCAT
jgi:hypothetical protein